MITDVMSLMWISIDTSLCFIKGFPAVGTKDIGVDLFKKKVDFKLRIKFLNLFSIRILLI